MPVTGVYLLDMVAVTVTVTLFAFSKQAQRTREWKVVSLSVLCKYDLPNAFALPVI